MADTIKAPEPAATASGKSSGGESMRKRSRGNGLAAPDGGGSARKRSREYGEAAPAGRRTANRRKAAQFAASLYCRFKDDDVPALGAQLTYFLILSFFPFLMFVFAVLGSADLNVREVIAKVRPLLPDSSAESVANAIAAVHTPSGGSLLPLGLIAAVWSASSGVGAIMKALNKAYDRDETRPYWKVKGIALLFTVALGIGSSSCLLLLVFGDWIGGSLDKLAGFHGGATGPAWTAVQYVLPAAVTAAMYVSLYRFAPNIRLTFKETLPGALFAVIGWIAASLAFSLYVDRFGAYSRTYGSLGGVIVLLVWLYLTGIVIVLGGEINAVLHFAKHGKRKEECKHFALRLPPFLKGRRPPADGRGGRQ